MTEGEQTPRSFREHPGSIVVSGREYQLTVLDNDEVVAAIAAEDDAGERLNPYFGTLWPASIALGEYLDERGGVAGKRTLDLGCGVGLVGLVAARLGADVTFADIMPEAVELARRNAAANALPGRFMYFDLREAAASAGHFDLVLCSDLLYEKWKPAAIATALTHLLAPGGTALIADPNRPSGDSFAAFADAAGFAVEQTEHRVSIGKATPSSVAVRIFELRAP